jgi:hypothetical protein
LGGRAGRCRTSIRDGVSSFQVLENGETFHKIQRGEGPLQICDN